jgi:hypothetical protein
MNSILRTMTILATLSLMAAALAQTNWRNMDSAIPIVTTPGASPPTTSIGPNGLLTLSVVAMPTGYSVVVNGVATPTYAAIANVIVSPNGQRTAFLAQQVPGGPWIAVVDGLISAPYQMASNLMFSPDSKHYAFYACNMTTGHWSVNTDGVAGKPCFYIANLSFSANSDRVTYVELDYPGNMWIYVTHWLTAPTRYDTFRVL